MVTIVALGPGDPDALPAAALGVLAGLATAYAPRLPTGLGERLPLELSTLDDVARLPSGAVVVADDAEAHRLACRLPDAATIPAREVLRARAVGAEVARLVQVGARLRRDCPWDREQTAETIVPHTVEEAFEVAEAVSAGDPARQIDELGDLLFQTVFLGQLLSETGEGDLAVVARGQADKLISRHPHVYGDAVAESAGRVLDLWERRKREERAGEGIFHEIPPGLPALAHAAKVQKRAAAVGFEFQELGDALATLDREVAELHGDPGARELGDVAFACISVARRLDVDLEIALRATAGRFRGRVERAAALAEADGQDFEELTLAQKLHRYGQAKDEEATRPAGGASPDGPPPAP